MTIRFAVAAAAALILAGLAAPALAGCVIAPDHKSIDVVADNPSSDQKDCAISCKVDTKVGVVQISCGGVAPPLAKGLSLCNFGKPDAWYKTVISAKDDCKASADSAPAKEEPKSAPAKGFACKIAPDGKSVDAMIANPYKSETSCQIDCQISTTSAGTTFGLSCTHNVAPGGEPVVLCSKTFDKGGLVKVVDGQGSCLDPTPAADPADKDTDADADAPPTDPAKLRDYIRKKLQQPDAPDSDD